MGLLWGWGWGCSGVEPGERIRKRAKNLTLQSHLIQRDIWLLTEELSHQYDLFSSHCLESLWGTDLTFPRRACVCVCTHVYMCVCVMEWWCGRGSTVHWRAITLDVLSNDQIAAWTKASSVEAVQWNPICHCPSHHSARYGSLICHLWQVTAQSYAVLWC